ncbi:MAG TPA: outer membrane beta-barrel protein [Bryobacteraceae bacterium]
MAASISNAQEAPRFAFSIGGGFTQPVGNTGRHLNEGWNIGAGAGVNFGSYAGLMIDVGYNSFGINSATLNNIGFPDGGLHVFSATLDPIIHLTPRSHFDMYVTGGGGLYRREQVFTQPTVQSVTGFDPFFGFYSALIPVNQVLASSSVVKPGVDVGAGVALGTKWHGKVFAEARYNRIFMGNFHTDYIPVSFGFRW